MTLLPGDVTPRILAQIVGHVSDGYTLRVLAVEPIDGKSHEVAAVAQIELALDPLTMRFDGFDAQLQ
jgi:hypothetical protein